MILRPLHQLLAVCFVSHSIGVQADTLPALGGEITITPMVHSSVQLEYDNLVIQIDPWSAIDLSNYKTADLILITDSPGHHRDLDAIHALQSDHAAIIIPANSREALPNAVVINNGERLTIAGVTIEAVAAYDIIPGAPEHPKGDANGYIVTLGDKRLYFAGVTECVEEVLQLRDIDVAFMPMNIPRGRMTPQAAADCTQQLNPDFVYIYHYNQNFPRLLANPDAELLSLPGDISIEESLDQFDRALSNSSIEFRRAPWYPQP